MRAHQSKLLVTIGETHRYRQVSSVFIVHVLSTEPLYLFALTLFALTLSLSLPLSSSLSLSLPLSPSLSLSFFYSN